MSSDEELIARIEKMTTVAWPPREVITIAGWELRATGGFSRRANSANPYAPHPGDLVAAVAQVEAWYRERGLASVFRFTPVSNPPGLDSHLADRGYEADRGTLVMVGDAAGTDSAGVEMTDRPTPEWIAAKDRWSPLHAPQRREWLGLLERTRSAAVFGLLRDGGRTVAAGHAVVHDGLVALFGLVVDPRRRREGFGERLTRGLVDRGASRGATCVWLQVHSPTNSPAVALYRKLGFATLYEYWYREAPV